MDPWGSCGLVERKTRRDDRFDDGAIVVYHDERRDRPSSHHRPVYVTASINGVELKWAMLNLGSSLNIVSLSILDAVGIPRERITRQLIEGSSLRVHNTYNLGFVNIDLAVGTNQTAHGFHVIECKTTYHLLPESLGYTAKAIPFTYHQCLKAIWKCRRIHVNATESSFQPDEAHIDNKNYDKFIFSEEI